MEAAAVVRMCIRGLFGTIAAASLPVHAGNITPLPDATFNEYVDVGSGLQLGGSLAVPETLFDDLQQSSASMTREAQAQVITTGGGRPAVDVVASSQVTNLVPDGVANGLRARAGGDISYSISIQPRQGVTLPGGTTQYAVPITVQALGSVSWKGSNLDDFVSGTSLARVNYNGRSVELIYGFGAACAASTSCVSGPGGEFDFTFDDTLTWNSSTSFAPARSIQLAATVSFQPLTLKLDPRQTLGSNSVSVQSIADPVLAFVNPSDAERFEFIVSAGIATAPAPPPLWLLGSGLALLGAIRAFRV